MEIENVESMETRWRPRLASNLLLWIILGFVAVFVFWAALTKLDRTIHGMGRVVPSARLQVVSNLEGGIVDEIFVKTGENVKAGAPLVRMSLTMANAELGSGRATIAALNAKIARLQAQITETAPVFPTPTNQAEADSIAVERSLYASSMADLNSSVSAIRAQILQAQRAVSEAQSMHSAKLSAKHAAEQQIMMIRPLVEKGIEPQISLIQAENQVATSAGEAGAAAAGIARAQAGVAEANANLNRMQQDWRSKAATELAAAQGELSSRRSVLPALADKARRTLVTAPLDGRVNRVLVATVGGSVTPGSPIAEIVPVNEGLVIEALINPKDIAAVHIGQKAKIGITAYDSSVYGRLDGSVVTMSPDSVVNEKTGESFYHVQIRTNGNGLRDVDGKQLTIGAGMVADVSLLGGKRSVLSYILSPLTRLEEDAMRE
jgi:membrane fusion protein, adhesin transport system